MILRSLRHLAWTGLLLAGILAAHYTWIAPVSLVKGKAARIAIGHGHHFPESEEAIAAAQVKAFAVAPSGNRSELKAAKAGRIVEVDYTPVEEGTHAIGFVQDRGVTSRTPAGVKPGGRDVNKDAVAAFRTIRTAVTFATTGRVTLPRKSLGLDLEIVPRVVGTAVTLQLTRSGKPLAGQSIEVLTSASKEAKTVGETDAAGTVVYQTGTVAGPLLFIAGVAEPAAKGLAYETTNLSTSLYLGR